MEDVREQKDFIKPIEPEKKKLSFWKKMAVLIPVVFLVTWVFAMWNPLEKPAEAENLIQVGSYDFYEMEEGLFATPFTYGGKKIPVYFRLDPREAGNISLEDQAVQQIINSKKIYLTFNPNHPDIAKIIVAAGEVARIISLYGIEVITAYTEDSSPVNLNIPLKTCEDVSEEIGIVYINTGEATEVIVDMGCVVVNGKTADETIMAADKLGMNLIGIRL